MDVDLAIVYLMANFFFKKNSQNYCNFYVWKLNIQTFKVVRSLVSKLYEKIWFSTHFLCK